MVITLGMIELVGLTGIVSFPRAFGQVRGETWQDRVVPNLDIKGRTYQDLTYDSRIPTEPIEFHYVTDRHGFRNGNDRSEADIYLVGDSILVAGLLPFDETIAALVEKDLKLRTMNVAIAGLAVQEERDLFKAAKLPLQNHLVLHFVYEGNDLQDSARYRNRIPMKQLSALERSFSYNFLSWLIDRSDKRPLRRRFEKWNHSRHELFIRPAQPRVSGQRRRIHARLPGTPRHARHGDIRRRNVCNRLRS